MEKIKLTIRGVMFALFLHYDKTKPGSEELVEQAIQWLDELNKKRPAVILVPEPDNLYNPKAIQAWCEGKPIGHVVAEETKLAHSLFDAEHEMMMARIVHVEVIRKGNIYVEAELPEGALLKKKNYLNMNFYGSNGHSMDDNNEKRFGQSKQNHHFLRNLLENTR